MNLFKKSFAAFWTKLTKMLTKEFSHISFCNFAHLWLIPLVTFTMIMMYSLSLPAIGAALWTQEQLKFAGFCSQLDADDGDDDNEGDNNVVDEDDDVVDKDNDNVGKEDRRAEGLLKVGGP
jgi:hypothetical protein